MIRKVLEAVEKTLVPVPVPVQNIHNTQSIHSIHSTGVRRIELRQATLSTDDAIIVCVIIAKSRVYQIKTSTSNNNNNTSTASWRITIRDNNDTANCTVWGNMLFCTRLADSFTIGDVVDIIRPRFKAKIIGDRNEQYVPEVSLSLNLVLNEQTSEMLMHDGEDTMEFSKLIHVPTKPPRGYYTLADVLNNGKGQEIREDFIDLLVAVVVVLPTRHIVTKTGGEVAHREVIVSDQSTNDTFRISVWDPDMITRISSWTPRETVLFIADIKLEWSDFHKSTIGRIDRRTVVTEDPYTTEAETLRVYIQHAPRTVTKQIVELNFPDVESVKNIMTVQQIKDRMSSDIVYDQFTAVLYGTITDLDLDGIYKCVVAKCNNCSSILKASPICQNGECQMRETANKYDFDMWVSVTDYTGTLNKCKLTGAYAEQILDCTASEFINLSDECRGQIKWKKLMERQIVKLVICKGPLAYIIGCSRPDPNELITKLPIY